MSKPTLLTGIRASGHIHLGNYLGAMLPAIQRQDEFHTYLFIADYHGLTSTPPAEQLRGAVRSIAAAWLAAGLDPEKTVMWKQSDVKEHIELAYILSCVTSMGLLERAHSYKDAKAKSKVIKHGIFYYPILMAADILLYDADYVPVGKDQAQHLEMARDMATFFNETYGEALKPPKELIQENLAIVPGTDGRKMSKSYNNGIEIFESDTRLKKQIMGIVTDSKELDEPKDPDSCTVYTFYKLLASPDKAKDMYEKLKVGGYGYGHAKKDLLEQMHESFDPMRKEYDRWMSDSKALDEVLSAGAVRAREKAGKMMDRIKALVGL